MGEGSVVLVSLHSRAHPGRFAIVDVRDAGAVLAHRWRAHLTNGYVYAETSLPCPDGGTRPVTLHQFLMGEPPGMEINHTNKDTLDCRRENLRPATHQQTMQNKRMHKNNKTGFKGVQPYGEGRFRAFIRYDGKLRHIGLFDTAEAAARAYDALATKHFGEFARTNFPPDTA